jgi:hypothetical protein
MAEAIKPLNNLKPKTGRVTAETTREQNEVKITDKYLEQRLKSLTSFINNIEPTPKTVIFINIFL